MQDTLHKFIFADHSVRVEAVRLSDAWRQTAARHIYPPAVNRLLGELVAASTLMAANLKFDGSLLLQLQGDGAVALLVAECRADLSIRATVKLRDRAVSDDDTLQTLVNPNGTGRFVVVLDPPKDTPGRQTYQGVVPIEGDSVAEALEQYMLRSEQLHTRIWLAANDQHCAGVLLQQLPTQGGVQSSSLSDAQESWIRANHLADTIKPGELLSTEPATMVHRLFWDETLLVTEPRRVIWRCSCTRERVADMLRMLGKPELDSILQERSKVEVSCEFCGKPYEFDMVDAAALFQPVTSVENKSLH